MFKMVIALSLMASTLSYGACFSGSYTMPPRGQEVKDTKTGLTWQRCSPNRVGSFCTGEDQLMTESEAVVYALSQVGWRVPTEAELASLIQKDCLKTNKSSLNSVYFPNASASGVWTTTKLDTTGPSVYQTVNFTTGLVEPAFGTAKRTVRLVK